MEYWNDGVPHAKTINETNDQGTTAYWSDGVPSLDVNITVTTAQFTPILMWFF